MWVTYRAISDWSVFQTCLVVFSVRWNILIPYWSICGWHWYNCQSLVWHCGSSLTLYIYIFLLKLFKLWLTTLYIFHKKSIQIGYNINIFLWKSESKKKINTIKHKNSWGSKKLNTEFKSSFFSHLAIRSYLSVWISVVQNFWSWIKINYWIKYEFHF